MPQNLTKIVFGPLVLAAKAGVSESSIWETCLSELDALGGQGTACVLLPGSACSDYGDNAESDQDTEEELEKTLFEKIIYPGALDSVRKTSWNIFSLTGGHLPPLVREEDKPKSGQASPGRPAPPHQECGKMFLKNEPYNRQRFKQELFRDMARTSIA